MSGECGVVVRVCCCCCCVCVPVRAGPLINRCAACRALEGRSRVAGRTRHVVVRNDGGTHGFKRPVGGVPPADGGGVTV